MDTEGLIGFGLIFVLQSAIVLYASMFAFDVLHYLVEKRLKGRRFTVIDANNVQPESRKGLVALARKWHALAVAIVFEVLQPFSSAALILPAFAALGVPLLRSRQPARPPRPARRCARHAVQGRTHG